MASTEKERRIDNSVLKVANATHTLCITNQKFSDAVKLSPLKIKRSNATSGVPFSKAFCDIEGYDVEFLIGDVFHPGITLLTEYLYHRKLPVDKTHRLLIGKLLEFIKEEKKFKINPQTLIGTELAVLLANHLFGKLATSSCYTIDTSCAGKRDQCFCDDEACKMTGQYGDTSIGNGEVWHGNLDIIINSDLIVEPLKDLSNSPGGKNTDEVNVLSRNPQVIAQTIVYSFLQKKTHPERTHFLTPCVGVGNSSMVVMFYDSEQDVFIESSPIPLFQTTGPGEMAFDDTAILVSWLTVNYRFLSSGLTTAMRVCKGDFFKEAEEKLSVYEEELQLGNVTHCLPFSFQKKSLQLSSFLEEQETKLIKIIHREIREHNTQGSST